MSEEIEFEIPLKAFRQAWTDRGEREWLRRLLERHGGCVATAAAAAHVDRSHLHRLIRKHRKFSD
jgi:transcriptional regulator of acetoin/glycerol metabolism